MTTLLVKFMNAIRLLPTFMRYSLFRRILGRQGLIVAWRSLGCQIGQNVWISPHVKMRDPKNVSIDDGTRLAGRVLVDSWGKISIGKNVLMNDDIFLFSAEHEIDCPDFFDWSSPKEHQSIEIGDYVWLPHHIIVLPGVKIGNYAVVGTGSVVAKSIPDYGVAAGNPAKVVKERARVDFRYVPGLW